MRTWMYVLLFLGLLFVSNRYLSIQLNYSELYVIGPDSLNYLAIAEKSPGLASIDAKIPFHHGQRFFMPYVLGGVSKILGMPLHPVFMSASIIFVLLTVVFFNLLLLELKISPHTTIILNGLLILNPYLFRYYLSIPYLINDIFFVFCITLATFCLIKKYFSSLVVVLAFAALARQTALPFMFFPMAWIALFHKQKIKFIFIYAAVVVVAHFFSSYVASLFSVKGANLEAITSLFYWLKNSFDLKNFLEFILRCFIPILFALTFYILFRKKKLSIQYQKANGLLWAATLFIFIQPFLGGPQLTGQSATRLTALALVPLLIALALKMEAFRLKNHISMAFILSALMSASLHPVYSWPGKEYIKTPVIFVLINLILMGLVALVVNSLTKARLNQ